MSTVGLSDDDVDLVEAAVEAIRPRYVPGKDPGSRAVGTALRTDSGSVYTAVNLTAATPRASVCAEPIAIGEAVSEGETDFDTIVAVLLHPDDVPESNVGEGELFEDAAVISACGVCRELIRDYDPNTYVIVSGEDGLQKVRVSDTLPSLRWRSGGE